MAMKLLEFVDPGRGFVGRLVESQHKRRNANRDDDDRMGDRMKVWLFPNQLRFRTGSSFQPF